MRLLFAVCFIANLLAVVVVLSVDGAKSSSVVDNKTPVPAKKGDIKEIGEAVKSLEATLKENFKQLISAVVNVTSHEKPEEPNSTFASCRDTFLNRKSEENKAYMLQMDTGKIPVYCHMSNTGLGACGGGGWTLAMKIDGTKRTFHYDSKFWSSKIDYNLQGGENGFDTQETKLPTYWNTRFDKICLGMRMDNHLNFIMVTLPASSLYSLIADGAYRATSLGRNTWKKLIGVQASLQSNCNREGFNAYNDVHHSKARIGIIANQQNDCNSCNSRIGFGTGGSPDDSNTCGNEADNSPDNGDKHIKAMGYILVQ